MIRLVSIVLLVLVMPSVVMTISSELVPKSAFHHFRRNVMEKHRLLEDAYMDGYYDVDDDQGRDGMGFDMSCDFDENMELSCTFTFQSDVLSTEMTCSFSDDASVMYCNTCSTEYGVYNDDESQVQFCFDSTCDVDGMGDTDLEEYCTCTGATVNQVACDSCAFCKTDDISYDVNEASQSGAAAYGMALQCPYAPESFLADTQCPASAARETFSAAMTVGLVAGVLALVAIVGYVVMSKFMKKSQEDKVTPFVQMNDGDPKGVVA